MKLKIIAFLLLLSLPVVSIGCGNKMEKHTISDAATMEISGAVSGGSGLESEYSENVFSSEEAKDEDSVDFDVVTEWYRDGSSLIGEGIYFVGKDIIPANYGIKCQTNGMRVIVFDTEEDYYNYHHMSRFTYGEEKDAIEANASQNDYIYEGDEKALNLKAGNVLRIKDGIGELLFSDSSSKSNTETKLGQIIHLFDGYYGVEKDIPAGGYMLTATGKYGTRFVVFASDEKVKEFEETEHFTNGEFGADVEKNAIMDVYVNKGKQCYINLKEGMVLMVHNGSATVQEVTMAWSQ